MKDYQTFLIDLDGTIYRGKQTIEAGVRFVKRLEQANKKYLFLTNNTTRTPQMVVDKLKKHGVITDVNHIYTPSIATASYILKNNQSKKIGIYIIGEIGLWSEIMSHPQFFVDEITPNYVIVGMDTDLTYHKLRVATKAIYNGATFIGTNADLNLPSGSELLPGNGSVCTMLTAATRKKPLYIGKPERIIVDMALQKFNIDPKTALIVGDNYDTDIKAGFNSCVDTLLVYTGVTKKSEMVGKKAPTYEVDSLDEFIV